MDVKMKKEGEEHYSDGQRGEQMDGKLKKLGRWSDGCLDKRMNEGQK